MICSCGLEGLMERENVVQQVTNLLASDIIAQVCQSHVYTGIVGLIG
jgi:hypothetical protein